MYLHEEGKNIKGDIIKKIKNIINHLKKSPIDLITEKIQTLNVEIKLKIKNVHGKKANCAYRLILQTY